MEAEEQVNRLTGFEKRRRLILCLVPPSHRIIRVSRNGKIGHLKGIW